MLKLKWEHSYDHYRCYPLEGAIALLIRHAAIDNIDYAHGLATKWEIIIGVRYWSRDTGKYFTDILAAQQQAEILVVKICQKMLKELEQ